MARFIKKREIIKRLLTMLKNAYKNKNLDGSDVEVIYDEEEAPDGINSIILNEEEEEIEYVTIGSPRDKDRTLGLVVYINIASEDNSVELRDEFECTLEDAIGNSREDSDLNFLLEGDGLTIYRKEWSRRGEYFDDIKTCKCYLKAFYRNEENDNSY